MTEAVLLASLTKTIEVVTSEMVREMNTTTSRNTLLAIRCRTTLTTCVTEILILRTRQIITETNRNITIKEEEDPATKTSTDVHHQGNGKANSTVTIRVDLAQEAVRGPQ